LLNKIHRKILILRLPKQEKINFTQKIRKNCKSLQFSFGQNIFSPEILVSFNSLAEI